MNKPLLSFLLLPSLVFAAAGDVPIEQADGTIQTKTISGDATVDVGGVVTVGSGDSATGFFSSGTIEHERGGLEADVSAYDGILRISGGSTTAVTDLSGLNTALGSIGLVDTGTLTDTKYCTWDAAGSEIDCDSEGGGGGAETNSLETVMTGALTGEIPIATTADTATYSKISALTEETAPAAGDFLLGEESGGNVRRFDVGDLPGVLTWAASNKITPLTTDYDNEGCIYVDKALTLTGAACYVETAGGTSGSTTIDIEESGTSILSTECDINAGDNQDDGTVAISDTAIAAGAQLCIDVDSLSADETEAGLQIWLEYY